MNTYIRILCLLSMIGDKNERDALIREVTLYIKRYGDTKFLDELNTKDIHARYDFLREWSSAELEDGVNEEALDSLDVYAERLYYMYFLNRVAPVKELLTREWSLKVMKKHPGPKHWERVLRLAEKKLKLTSLGRKWEQEQAKREKFKYNGPNLLTERGFVEIKFTC